ncbi:MAG: FmdB family zinc ribbon protein [Chloroflexota bacterium]
MPLYDFRCPSCGQVYEVKRSAARMADPLSCVVDQTFCDRVLTAPSFVTKSNASYRLPTAAQRASWNHFGHTHGADASGHAHGAGDAAAGD